MPVSEKKRLANRANAQKSTGPRSRDGKAKVALNSLRHGLRSKEVVLPGEDPAAFDQMLASWMDDWQPPTDARRLLIEQAVAHAWRLRRCLKVERDHLAERGRDAVRDHDKAASKRVNAALARLGRDPAGALESLLDERLGAEAVLGLWRELAASATASGWSDMAANHVRLLNLLGLGEEADADDVGGAVMASWRLIEWNQPEPTDEAHAARLTVSASLDDSPAGRALLRYEGQHGREFRATLNQLIKLTQTGVDLAEDEPDSEPQAVSESKVEPDPAPAPSKATEAESPAPSKATEGPAEGVPGDEMGPDGLAMMVAGLGEHQAKQQV